MLEGNGLLYLPPYDGRAPVEYTTRCHCGRRFLVFNPTARGVVGNAEGRAKERAEAMRCRFINSSFEPFVTCPCGQPLDFATGDVCEKVM